MIRRRKPRAVIHVNQHVIRHNAKHEGSEPPLAVKTQHKGHYGKRIVITHDGREVAEVVYRPDQPLSCGARVWIELGEGADFVVAE